MFIFDSNRFSRDPGGVAGQVNALIQKFGGEILAGRLWEERRLAYPINGQRKGTYWLTYFRLESRQLAEFNREWHLNESILRALVLKVDPRIVDALVAHATQTPQPAEAPKPAVKREEPAMEAVPEEIEAV
jgi:small subunit ribosomal protein S6